MTKALALLLVLTVSAPAQAQTYEQEICSAISRLARAVMQKRQAGATMAEMMAGKAESPEFQELGETLIVAAFDEPVAGTEEAKQKAVNAFECASFEACSDASP